MNSTKTTATSSNTSTVGPSDGAATASPIHLAIEAYGVKHGGGATVLNAIVEAALSHARIAHVSIFCSPKKYRVFSLPASQKLTECESDLAERNRAFRLWWLETMLPRRLSQIGANIAILLGGAGNAGGLVPHVTFLQQPLPFYSEASSQLSVPERLRVGVIGWAMARSAKRSCKVFVQTPAMKAVVCSKFGLEPNRIRTFEPSVPPASQPTGTAPAIAPMRRAAPGKRILYVGSQARHKNVAILLEAAGLLKIRVPEARIFLTWPHHRHKSGLDNVFCLGPLAKDPLAEAFSLADLLVMPSITETVGLPMLEAMAAGVPVIAADRPYAFAVCGDAAEVFDPYDSNELAFRIEAILRDSSKRTTMIRKGYAIVAQRRESSPYVRLIDELVVEANVYMNNSVCP